MVNNNFIFKNSNKKGFGGVASTLIMFIAIISVTTGLVIAFMNYTQDTKRSLDSQNKLTSNKIKTSISITNVIYNSTSDNLYIYVKNIGDTQLNTELFDLFIDEKFYNKMDVYYADNLTKKLELFQPQDTCAVVKNIELQPGTHNVKVLTEYAVGDNELFNI